MAREKGGQSANIWLCYLQHLHEGYIPENVFNAYENGLLYRAIPSKSMVMKRSRCTKIKIAKKITTVVCVCATEKKNWAVDSWEEYNQHAFMAWRAQILVLIIISRTWMTTAVFTKWIKKLNRMSTLKWKILLFVDSCSAHPPIQLTWCNVAIQNYLPPPALWCRNNSGCLTQLQEVPSLSLHIWN